MSKPSPGRVLEMAASSLPKVHVSFSGCGFLGVYHVGSMAAFQDHQKRSLEKEQKKDPPLPGEPPRFVIDHCLGNNTFSVALYMLQHSN